MAAENKANGYDVLMGLIATAGGMLGLLPLGQRIFGAEQGGLYGYVTRSLNLELEGVWTYLVPVFAMVVLFGLVLVIDNIKKKRA
ncbi:hypothetical protein [Amycolatopsis sp. CA-230715]|uniref:hypothetical protein n=1 Tax=Amycolatopsis sp. CA-230715 TaxID=2745196 RepID=UPI001C01B36E|nr:hypothetical protein [Amycolatopsis sp. CA-230715]QWF78557.1 hypothetical protein HUW46_01953 [Amycolatopsis sp. CA-230715]